MEGMSAPSQARPSDDAHGLSTFCRRSLALQISNPPTPSGSACQNFRSYSLSSKYPHPTSPSTSAQPIFLPPPLVALIVHHLLRPIYDTICSRFRTPFGTHLGSSPSLWVPFFLSFSDSLSNTFWNLISNPFGLHFSFHFEPFFHHFLKMEKP